MIFAMIRRRFCPPAIAVAAGSAFGRGHATLHRRRRLSRLQPDLETMVELTPEQAPGGNPN